MEHMTPVTFHMVTSPPLFSLINNCETKVMIKQTREQTSGDQKDPMGQKPFQWLRSFRDGVDAAGLNLTPLSATTTS